MTIWKFPLHLTGDTWDLALPVGYRILTVQLQGDRPCVWALVDAAELNMVRAKVRCFGTGGGFPVSMECPYLGTVQLHQLGLVLHFFLLTDPEGLLIP